MRSLPSTISRAHYLELLETCEKEGIPAFDCRYADAEAERAYALSRKAGLVPYRARRPLSRLTRTPPPP